MRPGRGDTRGVLAAAITYFASVFALGFPLGVMRTLAQAYWPTLDRVTAVLIELPVILTACWLIAGQLVRRFAVPARAGARLIMGGAALVLLLGAEAALSLSAGRSLAAHVALYSEASHQIGLAGQIVFALIPLLQLRARAG
jgi:hypothetical protein